MQHFFLKRIMQHRALFCYSLLSLWIILMIGGTYRVMNVDNVMSSWLKKPPNIALPFAQKRLKDFKKQRLLKPCNPIDDLSLGSEGQFDGKYNLEGTLILLRHGDRGPLSHLRNISSINCGINEEDLMKQFESYQQVISNITYKISQNSMLSSFLSQIQNSPQSPLLPLSKECELGQLTPLGIVQLMKTGKLLNNVYANYLSLNSKNFSNGDIIVFSTKYKRTIQSVIAFLSTFLNVNDLFRVVNLKESNSLAYCFNECACPAAETYLKYNRQEASKFYKNHASTIKIVRKLSTIIFETTESIQNVEPHTLKDGLLAFVCHNAELPCYNSKCVRNEHIVNVFNYIEHETRNSVQSHSLKLSLLLKTYGFLKEIVSQILRIISDRKPKIVIYSAHDKTIKYTSAAFGILNEFTALPPYASRFIIEVLSTDEKTSPNPSGVQKKHFFRLLFNGQDYTRQISFCKSNLSVASDEINASFVCPVESIIRYLHDDFFLPFNTTNFKDACSLPQQIA